MEVKDIKDRGSFLSFWITYSYVTSSLKIYITSISGANLLKERVVQLEVPMLKVNRINYITSKMYMYFEKKKVLEEYNFKRAKTQSFINTNIRISINLYCSVDVHFGLLVSVSVPCKDQDLKK